MTNKYITSFLDAIVDGLESGSWPKWFTPSIGLCNNLVRYAWHYEFTGEVSVELDKTLRHILFNGRAYPFDDIDGREYERDARAGTLYQNPKRLEFIYKHSSRGTKK
jgi:hypothetical protein